MGDFCGMGDVAFDGRDEPLRRVAERDLLRLMALPMLEELDVPDLLYLLHFHFANCPLYILALIGVRIVVFLDSELSKLSSLDGDLRSLELVS